MTWVGCKVMCTTLDAKSKIDYCEYTSMYMGEGVPKYFKYRNHVENVIINFHYKVYVNILYSLAFYKKVEINIL